ncbi:MAG: hypothetical protein C4582_01680 [Desulfobacteraceae bacterium]|nr:MAG: hypothetical protein C4582_01680 [Desulfobacteraceae bacterium]
MLDQSLKNKRELNCPNWVQKIVPLRVERVFQKQELKGEKATERKLFQKKNVTDNFLAEFLLDINIKQILFPPKGPTI